MGEPPLVLILGGTDGGRQLAAALEAHPRLRAITALAGRTADPVRVAGEVRVGGFGGSEGMAAFLRQRRIVAVVDATHPFARTISRHAVEAAASVGLPLLRLERPPWPRRQGDHWTEVPDTAAAAAALPAEPATVFLAIGRQELAPFATRPEHRYVVRMIDPPAGSLPIEPAELVLARGPFDEAGEAALIESRAIDVLVSKNAGGPATYAKIAAARRLGLPVVMVARPALPAAPTAATVDEALAWLDRPVSRARRSHHGLRSAAAHDRPAEAMETMTGPTGVLRRYKPADEAAAMAVWSAASKAAHPFIPGEGEGERARVVRELYLPNAETWVVDEDGDVVGLLGLLDSEIGGLFVRPDRQGGGWGRRMVDHAAALKGALTVEVFELNHRARVFYAAMGFVEIGRRLDEETGSVLVRMARPVPAADGADPRRDPS